MIKLQAMMLRTPVYTQCLCCEEILAVGSIMILAVSGDGNLLGILPAHHECCGRHSCEPKLLGDLDEAIDFATEITISGKSVSPLPISAIEDLMVEIGYDMESLESRLKITARASTN